MIWRGLLGDLLDDLPAEMRIEIETNGTIKPLLGFDRVHFNVSPKLTGFVQDDKRVHTMRPEVLKEYIECYKAIFKFVITEEKDKTEVLALQHVLHIPSNRIWLMPQGSTSHEMAKGFNSLFLFARDNGFNLSSRLHVLAFENERGI